MFRTNKLVLAAGAAAASFSLSTFSADARNQINIVGSSTVFPFATSVAERFGKNTDFKTPVVESTGSGGGLKLFCGGIGTNTPDITKRIAPHQGQRSRAVRQKRCERHRRGESRIRRYRIVQLPCIGRDEIVPQGHFHRSGKRRTD